MEELLLALWGFIKALFGGIGNLISSVTGLPIFLCTAALIIFLAFKILKD